MIELTQIGYSSKSRGIGGQFKVRVEDKYRKDLLSARALFINLNGSRVPFIIESIEERKDLILKLEEITNPEQVSAFLNKEIYLSDLEISEENIHSNQVSHPFVGFQIIDQEDNLIGLIEEIIEYPNQLLASLKYKDKPLLIPIHEDLILGIDKSGNSVKLEIAEGLLEL